MVWPCPERLFTAFHTTKTSADEARRLAAEWPPPKVAVLDIHPDGRGCELVTDARAIYSDCRFVLMSTARRDATGTADEDSIRIIEKPFELSCLVAQVADAVHDGSPAIPLS